MCTLDDRLQVRHLHRRNHQIPVAEDHRGAGAAEQRRRAQKAGDGHRPAPSAIGRRDDHYACSDQRHERRRRCAIGDDRRTNRREHASDRRPVDTIAALRQTTSASSATRSCGDGRRECRRLVETRSAIAIRIAARPALKRKNFTPASRETSDEREDDADAEMGEEEEEDGGERHGSDARLKPSRYDSARPEPGVDPPAARAFLPRPTCPYSRRLLISAQLTTFHQASM